MNLPRRGIGSQFVFILAIFVFPDFFCDQLGLQHRPLPDVPPVGAIPDELWATANPSWTSKENLLDDNDPASSAESDVFVALYDFQAGGGIINYRWRKAIR